MFRTVLLSLCLSLPALAVETVRIDMGTEGGDVTLEADGLSFGADVEDGAFKALSSSKAVIRRVDDHLVMGAAPLVGDSVRFRSADAGGINTGALRVRGEVVVRMSKQGLQLINVIPLEDYLAAVLGSEMPASFPDEALKAQAVAARTYALQRKLEAYSQPFHLGSSVLSQVYGGLSREDKRTRAAVDATRGEVLTYELQPIEAYFHSSCGGRTESGMAALGRNLPYLQSVSCPCGSLAQSRWELNLPASELKSLFGSEGKKLQVSSRTSTGRATRVAVGTRSLDAVSFRQKVGYNRLKSLSFEVEAQKGDGLHIVGHGFGHGAGLCQWGAKVFADQGKDYREILAHYYPGAELQRIY
ncbi:MAG: SpoIID/LytB domain-containing protein [Myxococcaceae bacterium]